MPYDNRFNCVEEMLEYMKGEWEIKNTIDNYYYPKVIDLATQASDQKKLIEQLQDENKELRDNIKRLWSLVGKAHHFQNLNQEDDMFLEQVLKESEE